ncbi:uncharacterized protein [Anabrus simplex]|uniref:uncharacterized protein isoform X1 n=1 Tax=Anabrus simplex TaxID=316456 RepID=UPI0035A2D80C
MSCPKPKIEVVRMPSSEQAKLRPLIEDGVQLRAEFKHIRCGDYISYRSLEWDRDYYRFTEEDHQNAKQQKSYTAPPLSTKSCDNIFARQVVCERERERGIVGNPLSWRDATRSEEMLYSSPSKHQRPQMSCRSTGNVAQSTSTRSRITALFKKLSPRLRRPAPKPASCPWILVEFSPRDLEPGVTERRDGSHDSTTSDKSFEIALREAEIRKAKEKSKSIEQQLTTRTTSVNTANPTVEASHSALVPPQILIGTPASSPCESQLSMPGSPASYSAQHESRSKFHHLTAHLGSQHPDLASRPHTLLIQSAVCPTTSLAPGDPRVQPLTCKMASFESIGSCSLDAFATASEASETSELDSASRRTLHSIAVAPKAEATETTGSGASSPEYVKRTARLFEFSPGNSKGTAASPGIVVENGGTSKDIFLNGTTGKKPSYLGLACSISGYSGITTYDSKLREGFRSRDHSPGRLTLIRSRDTSPLRPDLNSETCFKSDCGNFLTAPKTSAGTSLGKSLLRSGTTENVLKTDGEFVSLVNGTTAKSNSPKKLLVNGTMEEVVKSDLHQINGVSEITRREAVSSQIRESSRHFMSSMLSESVDTRTKEMCGISSSVIKATSADSQEGLAASPSKPSPDSSKSVSKDSLSPASGSPQKRSPGAVRVVEFTSQSKSYVKTLVSSRTFLATSSSIDSPFNASDVTRTSVSEQCSSDSSQHQQTLYSSSSVESTPIGTVNKSFIQQRVERLYGPGALAQGFFRRTRSLSKSHDESQEVDASPSTTPASTPGLPVLRHLRPEFRAQLPLTTSIRRRLDDERQEVVHKETILQPVVLQQQVSVESLAESLPDMQPAAPEVVLPVDTVQPIVDSPQTPKLDHGPEAGDRIEVKDGHYFLKVLKHETDRLESLVAGAEEELGSGENLPEEALGKLRAASGQARLLMKQKLQQFEGLCHKNIAQSPQEAFPTTSQDLEGFWDMVKLQVDHVDRLFEEIRILRNANWVEEPQVSKDTVDGNRSTPSASKRRSVSKRTVTKPAASDEQRKASEAARKAREESRRKMMEERRKAMRQKATAEDTIEIFVPQENGSPAV